jgi:hypothetical protein
MWRLAKAFVTISFSLAMAFSAGPADAGPGCRYWILVSRQGFPGEETARVCDVGEVVLWLRAIPEAEVSTQAPPGALNDSFTVTVYLAKGVFRYEPGLEPAAQRGRLLTEQVYPVAESGPVAFVPSRSIFRGQGPSPRWAVPAGWRSLDASERVPTVLTRLGMLQPTAGRSTTPTPTATDATSTTDSSRPGPDLVTLLFVLAILASIGLVVWRRSARTHEEARDGRGRHSETSHHG